MFPASYNHESRSEVPRGTDPKSAASQLREILAASGKSQGILSQQRALIEWARQENRILGHPHELADFQPGGLEHLIHHDAEDGLVYKLTHSGAFGRTVRTISRGLAPATPLEYFDRWRIHNDLFSNLTQVVGVFDSAGCPQILVVQKALQGEIPTSEDVDAFMHLAGFEPLKIFPFAWKSQTIDSIHIFDARPANFLSISGNPIPFDLIPVKL
jgi:hypothetical protein